jgi:cation diffusion facilitator family transporter
VLVWVLSLKRLVPEFLAILLAIAVGISNFGFWFVFLQVLLLSILLRLVWNGAIIIHGLGHMLALAALDGHPEALVVSNLLENRSLEATLKSLLPGSEIFIPGVDRTEELWIEAGERTPWRISLKGISGVGFNLIAVAIALCSYSIAGVAIDFINQVFIAANLLVVVSSLSDFKALITGRAERFYCGNFGFLCQRLSSDSLELLPERMVNMFDLMGRETEIRGEQAGGGLVVARDRRDRTVFVGKKIVNRKRDNLTTSLEAAFAAERRKSSISGIAPLDSSVMGVWHYRFGTSGPPAVEETHWHEWMSARIESVWQFSQGKWICQKRNVNHRITHNGDFDAWTIFGKEVENVELGWWLERVLNTPNHTKGDSPKIAGMMDLLITKGIWSASVRLAYQLAIASSLESAFGAEEPAVDSPNTAPSEQDLSDWAEIFEKNFSLYLKLLGAPDSPSCNQYLSRLEHDIMQGIAQNRAIAQWSWQKRLAFVRTAIHAFFHNDLYFATKTFMSKAKGSFGLVTVSTLEEEQLVLSAQGQPIAIGYNQEDNYTVYASEPAAVDAVLLNLPNSYRLDLDRKTGEIALLSATDVTIYSLKSGSELTKAQLKNRWISMEDNFHLPHDKYPQSDIKEAVASDIQKIPLIFKEIKLSWQKLNPLSRVLLITLLLNLFVMGLKAFVGFKTNSLSLQADALHSVTDSANNVLGLIASRLSSPYPDRDHPYGHQKFEAVGALGIAAFLGVACFEIVQSALTRLSQDSNPTSIAGAELSILIFVLGINIFVAFYERRVGRELNSPMLIADAYHTMSDIWVTIAVLGGLIGVWQGQVLNLPLLQYLDLILAFPVALLVFFSGWQVLKENLPWLVDEMAVAPEAIHQIALGVPGVLNCHDIASRGLLGQQVFIEMHLIVDAPDVESAHKISEEVEIRLGKKFSPVRVLIHIEPPDYQRDRLTFSREDRA